MKDDFGPLRAIALAITVSLLIFWLPLAVVVWRFFR